MRTVPRPARTGGALLGVVVALAAALAAPRARAAGAEDVRATAVLEPRVVGLGETAELTLEVRGGVFSHVAFEPSFELDNFEIVGGPARVENLEYVNGATSRSVRLIWQLRPRHEGPAEVHSIALEVEGERLDLPAIGARVTRRPTGAPRPRPQRRSPWRLPDAFGDLFGRPAPPPERPEVRLVAEVGPRRAFAGEQLLYTLYLYTQANIGRVSADRLPDFRGFWVEEIPRRDDLPAEPVELDGETFWRTPLLQRALFPLRPGHYEIGPAEISMVAQIPFAGAFGRMLPHAEQISRKSAPVAVDVEPLPPPPADLASDFHGLVGQLELSARLAPARVPVGEAATLEVELSGPGNLEGAAAPEVAPPGGVEVLPPQADGTTAVQSQRVVGRRTWRFPLVARRAGSWRLPPVEVVYFDPRAAAYRRARTEPLVLQARQGAVETTAGGRPALHPIRNAALPAASPPWQRSDALRLAFAVPWLVALAVLLLARRRAGGEPARGGSGGGARERFAAGLAAAAAAERPRAAATALEDAWRALLAARADLPADAPAASWVRAAAAAGAGERSRDELERLIEDLHYLRYAPQLSAIAALRGELVERSRRLARRLEAELHRRAAA